MLSKRELKLGAETWYLTSFCCCCKSCPNWTEAVCMEVFFLLAYFLFILAVLLLRKLFCSDLIFGTWKEMCWMFVICVDQGAGLAWDLEPWMQGDVK